MIFKKKPQEPKIDFIQSFGKLEFQEGDIIILKHPNHLNEKSHARLLKFVKECIAPKAKAVVLEDGMDIGLLRPVEIEGRPIGKRSGVDR